MQVLSLVASSRKRTLGYGAVLDLFLCSRSLSSRISFDFIQPLDILDPIPVSGFLPSLASLAFLSTPVWSSSALSPSVSSAKTPWFFRLNLSLSRAIVS